MHQPPSSQQMIQQTIVAIDDHEMILSGIANLLRQQYPAAKIEVAQTRQEGEQLVASLKPDLAVVDLAIPERTGERVSAEVGVMLLESLMQQYPSLHIAVLSANAAPLVRLKPQIDNHEAGFTVSDKGWAAAEILKKVDIALGGGRFLPKEMKLGLELKPEWLDLLRLAFQESLTDKMIAKRMNISEKTVQNYFHKVQDVLEVYPEEGQNLRIQTGIKARQSGLID